MFWGINRPLLRLSRTRAGGVGLGGCPRWRSGFTAAAGGKIRGRHGVAFVPRSNWRERASTIIWCSLDGGDDSLSEKSRLL